MRLAALLLIVPLALGLALALRRRHLAAGWLQLLRVLFPSYRFFEDVTPVPGLWLRSGASRRDVEATTWREVLVAPPRPLHALFFNPAGNLHLAHVSLLERLVNELAERAPVPEEEARALLSYRMVAALARELASAPDTHVVEFKLRYGEPEEDVLVGEAGP